MACMKNGFIEGLQLDGRFTAISPLNHGSFGMVFLARDNQTNDHVAIKCLTKSSTPEGLGNDHLLELLCHDRLAYHKNIVNLIHAFETDAHMFLVLEFCSMGDLYEAIRLGRGPLETEHVRALMLQLVDAVEFMHSKGLYHRDVKPENIFLTANGALKLGDFGLSTTETWTHEACVGSDRYMAPEQYDPAEIGYSPAHADIWSIGICLLNILFSRNPFVTPTESDLLFNDFVRDRNSLFDIFPSMSQDTFNILIHALAIDPTKRSLFEVRKAIENVITFTSDDDIFDDFCTEGRPLHATGQRQPLRTPSIQSPPVEQSGAFPWAKVLHMSPTSRQLSVIHDVGYDEELFPEKPSTAWYSMNNDANSLASAIDSALGASIKSMNLREPAPRNLPKVSESMPIPKALASVFKNDKETMSKSWSDLWDEEEEEELDARRRYNARNWSSETIDEDITIRPGLTTLPSVADSNDNSPIAAEFSVFGSSEDIHAIPELSPITPKSPIYSPPAKRSVMDKWTALGNRRRAATVETKENKPVESNTWRRGFGFKAFSGNKGKPISSSFGQGVDINAGNGLGFAGWKHSRSDLKSGATTKEMGSGQVKIRDWHRDTPSVQRYQLGQRDEQRDDHGDSEWVGWPDLHL